MAWIKAGEFAAQLGVSGAAVRKAIAEGRLKSARKEGKGWLIDAEAGVEEWDRNTSPQFQRGRMLARQLAQQEQQQAPAPAAAAGTAVLGGKAIPSQAQAAAVRTMYQARLLELDLKQRQGELVNAADMDRVRFESGRRVRDALLRLGPLMVGEIAKAAGGLTPEQRAEVLLVIERHHVKALEALADANG
jgi:hypothetical protein